MVTGLLATVVALGSTVITQCREPGNIRKIFMYTKTKLLAVIFTLLLTSLVMAASLEATVKNNISDSAFPRDLLLFGVVGAALRGSQTNRSGSL